MLAKNRPLTRPFPSSPPRSRSAAYSDVMKIMLIAATVLAVVPLVLACFMPNWYLGDRQNAVDAADLKGERVVNPGQASSSQQPPVEQEQRDEKSSPV